MFAFEELENITNKVASNQASDLKIMAGNKIRLSTDAVAKLNLVAGRNVLILKGRDNSVVIASVDGETKQGRPINKNREFSHENIAASLNGHHSEWVITGEGQTHPSTGDTYFELTETVHGPDVVAELAAKVEAKEQKEEEVPVEAKESADEAEARAEAILEVEGSVMESTDEVVTASATEEY